MFEIASLITSILCGLFAGALLTEAGILVPYWRKMDPTAFLELHHTMAEPLFRFFAPLTIAGTISPTLNIGIAILTGESISISLWLAVGLSIFILILYFAFFKSANERFATTTNAVEASNILTTWAAWHNVRTILAIIVFILCVFSL